MHHPIDSKLFRDRRLLDLPVIWDDGRHPILDRMRYRPEHKAEIHRRIVNDASQRVRTHGMTAAAVSAVMHDVGLTHGGFYKHFANKDDLLIESLSQAFEDMSIRLVRAAGRCPRGSAWKAIVKAYLSPEHCENPGHGCPVASLAPELARSGKKMKKVILEQIANYHDRLLPFMPGRHHLDKERAFFAIFSTMIGAIAIARILPDSAARADVLANARRFLLRSF